MSCLGVGGVYCLSCCVVDDDDGDTDVLGSGPREVYIDGLGEKDEDEDRVEHLQECQTGGSYRYHPT